LSEEIVYLDPMEVEVDPMNVRYNSPLDEEIINAIVEDLKSGKGIEYHITVRVKNGKYYCYVGRYRLVAAKRFVKETGKRIKIPAKIRNVDDKTALDMSYEENSKRKELTIDDKIAYLKKRYIIYCKEKEKKEKGAAETVKEKEGEKAEIGINMPNLPPQKFDISKLSNGSTAEGGEMVYTDDIEVYMEKYPIRDFTREVELPLKKDMVYMYFAIDKLPRDIKLMIDRGELDILSAYLLTKIEDDITKKLVAEAVAKYKYIPRDMKVKALKQYVAEINAGRQITYSPIVLEMFGNYLVERYGDIFSKLSIKHLVEIAMNIPPQKYPRLARNLVYFDKIGYDISKFDSRDMTRIADLTDYDIAIFENGRKEIAELTVRYEAPITLEEAVKEFLLDGSLGLNRLKEKARNYQRIENEKRDMYNKLISLAETVRDFYSLDLSELSSKIEEILNEEAYDEKYIMNILNRIRDILLLSPGYSRGRTTTPGILYRIYYKPYIIAFEKIRSGNKEDIRKGLQSILDILREIDSTMDKEFNRKFSIIVGGIIGNIENEDTEIYDNMEEMGKYMKTFDMLSEFSEIYYNIRRYLRIIEDNPYLSGDKERISSLKHLYNRMIFSTTSAAHDKQPRHDSITRYVNNIRRNELYLNVEKFFSLKEEVKFLLDDIDTQISGIKDEIIRDQVMRKYDEYRDRYDEALYYADPDALLDVKRGLEALMNEMRELYRELVEEVEDDGNIIRLSIRITPRDVTGRIIGENEFENVEEKEIKVDGKPLLIGLRKKITYDIKYLKYKEKEEELVN